MKNYLFLFFYGVSNLVICQNDKKIDYTIAHVGEHIDGVYMFVNCEPIHPYQFITTVEATFTWKGSSLPINEQFRNIVKKCKSENNNFNAMIFRGENYNRVELILLEGLEVSLSGLSMRDTVSFLVDNEEYVGEVVGLVASNNTAKIKYKNLFNEQQIKTMNIKQLIKLDSEQTARLNIEFIKRCERYKFNIGDSVSWITIGFDRKIRSGTIFKLDELRHVADVIYTNEEGKQKIQAVNYINISKK